MTKFFLITVLLFLSYSTIAQHALPGNSFIGGTINLGSDKTETASTSPPKPPSPAIISTTTTTIKSTAIAANFGFFLTQRFAVGLTGDFLNTSQTTQTPQNINATFSQEIKNKTWSIGPLLRGFLPVSKGFGLFVQTALVWGKGSATSTFTGLSPSIQPTEILRGDISPGLYLILGRVGLEMRLGGYQYLQTKNLKPETVPANSSFKESKNTSSRFLLNAANIQIGLSLYLAKPVEKKVKNGSK